MSPQRARRPKQASFLVSSAHAHHLSESHSSLSGGDQVFDGWLGAEVFAGEEQLDGDERSRHGAVRGAPAVAQAATLTLSDREQQSRSSGWTWRVRPLTDERAITRRNDLSSVVPRQMQQDQDRTGFADGDRLVAADRHLHSSWAISFLSMDQRHGEGRLTTPLFRHLSANNK